VETVSTFWDIPGIRSKRSLEFLVKLLDPICVYDEQGQTVYASPPFLTLLQTDVNQVGFFDYFISDSTKLLTLIKSWERALQGETIWFISKTRTGQEDIECSLQFNPDTKLMFLIAKKVDLRAYTRELTEEYERWILALFNHPSLAIALLTLDEVVVNSNQRLHELLKTSEEETIYIEKLVHPEDKRVDLELKQKLLNGEIESYTVEKRFITKTNEIIWLNLSISLIEVPSCINKHKRYFAVLLEDVTENKKIYSALIRTEGKWKAFVLNNLNLFIQTSSAGQIIYASPAVERILGYRGEELLDWHISELIHPDDLNEFDLALRLWASEVDSSKSGIECRWRSLSGKWVYLYIQGQRFPLALEIDGIAISGYDITDRKLLEGELRASEEKFRSLILNIPGAVFRCDVTYTLEFISDAIQEITGFPASGFIHDRSRSYLSIVHPEDVELIKHSIVQSILEQHSCSIEYRIIHADGTLRWIWERRQAIFDSRGRFLWFDGVLFDVSDHKQTEQELRRSEAINRAMVRVLPDLMEQLKELESASNVAELPPGKSFKTILPPD